MIVSLCYKKNTMINNSYTIEISEPENKNELFGAWCEELQLSAFGETENEAFYNLIENIPLYFSVKSEPQRKKFLQKTRPINALKRFVIPAFA
ncbi:MAG: hypothetical protein WCJ84_03045 [Candidatus Peregrinibacteria bacterium]